MKKKDKKGEPEFPLGTMKIVKEWDCYDAKYRYFLYKYDSGLGGGPYAQTIYYWHRVAYGNLTWAKKNAAHYKIKIEGESKENEKGFGYGDYLKLMHATPPPPKEES